MFNCKECWFGSAAKLGKCPQCESFGSFEVDRSVSNVKVKGKHVFKWNILKAGVYEDVVYFDIWNKEILRVFGKGIKKGGKYLLAWEPGIGKSTIVLQLIRDMIESNKDIKILYISWEENVDQIVGRFKRVCWDTNIEKNINIISNTVFEDIYVTIESEKPDCVIIDSVQTVYSQSFDGEAGSPQQVRYIAEKLNEITQQMSISSFMIWHVTKWGEIAWPKYLEHIVDVVIYLEWDRFGQYRFLRCKKNRFGWTDEVWIFEMWSDGLQAVYDIKERIINQTNNNVPWNVLTIWLDNGRPILVNIEVLINKSKYKFPSKTAIWVDSNRLSLIVAVLEKYLNINLWFFDIYVNIPWEFKFNDSWLDLAIAAAIYSQYKDNVPDKNNIYIWEIWLGWQILKSRFHNKRVKEIPKWFNCIDFESMKNVREFV